MFDISSTVGQLFSALGNIKQSKHFDESISELYVPTENVLNRLKKIKPENPSVYKDSFLEYTEEMLKVFLKYLRYGEKDKDFEAMFLASFTGKAVVKVEKEGLVGSWKHLKYHE